VKKSNREGVRLCVVRVGLAREVQASLGRRRCGDDALEEAVEAQVVGGRRGYCEMWVENDGEAGRCR
jgi:hypothetical protein